MKMKAAAALLPLLVILLVVVSVATAGAPRRFRPIAPEGPSLARVWSAWKSTHRKVYAPADELVRFANFKNNVQRINLMNRVEGSNVFGLSRFADLSTEEFARLYLNGYRPSKAVPETVSVVPPFALQDIPQSFNWADHGALTPIYNQGQCGSCWAFSATEQIESMAWLAANNSSLPIQQLSMQQIVSCDHTDDGCGGGDTITAYAYVESAGGIEPLQDYPYTGENGKCQLKKPDLHAAVTSWSYVTSNVTKNETQMMYYVATTAPISICVDASSWQFYIGGVISVFCGQDLDHCVQIAGYSVETDVFGKTKPYWIIRNSWGADWGEHGYVYVEQFKNLCGVADEATTVAAHYL